MSTTKPRIGITLGDCAGIGPEIVELALKSGRVPESTEYVLLGRQPSCKPGVPTPETARAAAAALEEAVTLARRGELEAIVTGPVHKARMYEIGFQFPGLPSPCPVAAAVLGCDVRRVAITGIGVTAPGGAGRDGFWKLLTEGRCATRRISFFDPAGFRSQIAAECDFDPRGQGFTEREIRRIDRAALLAVCSARESIADSGIDLGAHEPGRVSVSLGSATGASIELTATPAAG